MNGYQASASIAIPLMVVLGSLGYAPRATADDLSAVLGVVDIERVLLDYPRAHELREQWRKEASDVNASLAQGKEKLDKLNLEANGWDAYTPEWISAQSRLSSEEAALTRRRELEQRRVFLKKLEAQEILYKDIDRAVAELGKKRNLRIVLRSMREVPASEPIDSRVGLWQSRGVLFHDDALDLTDDVINLLKSPNFQAAELPKAAGDDSKADHSK